MKQIDKRLKAQAIKELTNNGKDRTMVRKITNLMEDKETLTMLNALLVATRRK